MANSDDGGAVGSERRQRRKRTDIGHKKITAAKGGDIEGERRPSLDVLRALRTSLYTGGTVKHQRAVAPEMLSAAFSRPSSDRSRSMTSRHKVKRSTSTRSSTDRHRKKERTRDEEEDSTTIYVYGHPKDRKGDKSLRSRGVATDINVFGRDDSSYESDADTPVLPVVVEEQESSEGGSRRRKSRTRDSVDDEKSRLVRHASRKAHAEKEHSAKVRVRVPEKPLRRSSSTTLRRSSLTSLPDQFSRSRSTKQSNDSRPVLTRSNTLRSAQRPETPVYEASIRTATKPASSKPSGFLGLFTNTPKEPAPVRLVDCMVCMSDDVPRAKSAKLKCGHRMCHSCLKRQFRLSVKDPQHMPPKCCTAEHIPLKHVDRLFDNDFKKLWNKKYQEFTTKNRIYCPAKRCGEWIKPGNIHTENGKKYGKCGRCKTKVCCLCNGKWHGNKDCPKDEETNALLAAAKQAGWQRCYNCRTMVELKEGCNHMTCRCTAEFCMICGLKWKSCNCPWFNYDQVEADRLNHMPVPAADRLQHMRVPNIVPRDRPRPPPRPPLGYDEELAARRRQEQEDENFARRMQVLGIDDDDDFNGNIGHPRGVGNAGINFMNPDFRRPPPNRGVPPPIPNPPRDPASINRRPSARTGLPPARAAERVVPRRDRHDYAADAARHAPLGLFPQRRPRPAQPAAVPAAAPRPAVLAGLVNTGMGSGRVGAWRTYVHPGVEPAEGVISIGDVFID